MEEVDTFRPYSLLCQIQQPEAASVLDSSTTQEIQHPITATLTASCKELRSLKPYLPISHLALCLRFMRPNSVIPWLFEKKSTWSETLFTWILGTLYLIVRRIPFPSLLIRPRKQHVRVLVLVAHRVSRLMINFQCNELFSWSTTMKTMNFTADQIDDYPLSI